MRTIYIDSEFKCHITNDGTMTEVQTDFFDGKCDAFIEGYCFEPEIVKIYPWKPFSALSAAQEQYERDLADRADLEAAYNYLLNGGTA